jgi:ATP-dependent DNA helicase DinG
MLTDTDKDLVRQCMNALRDGIAGLRTRRPQLEMVAAVANTLACCRREPNEGGGGRGDHIAVIEAGTGTGKSFGDLVPALVMARTLGKRLVVSSSTVALQHQYAEKDAPMLQSLLPLDFSFAVAKGRRRYACTARLMAAGTAAGQQDLLSDESRDEHSGLQGQVHSASPPPQRRRCAASAGSSSAWPSPSRPDAGTAIETNSPCRSPTISGPA